MDILTHTAMGLFLSRAGLNRWTPCATPILLLAANAPDIDVVSALGGSIGYLNYHRHITHALIAVPVLALLTVALVRLLGRKPVNWVGALGAAMVGSASHLALDWTNIYGIRLLLPFSGEWFGADITSLVDLWIWGVILLGIAGPFLSGLVAGEMGVDTRGRPKGRGWAVFVLAFVVLYNGGRGYLHARATAMLDARLYDGETPARVMAAPHPANPLFWRGLVETSTSYSVHDLNLAREFDPAAGTVFHKADPAPVVDAARRTSAVRDFLRFSQYPLIRVLPLAEPEGARRVEAIDMRFGTPAKPGFMAWATVDGRLGILEAGVRLLGR